MTEIKKDDDAGAHAPQPKADASKTGAPSDKQDGKNYDDLEDGGRSVPIEDMNSANDE